MRIRVSLLVSLIPKVFKAKFFFIMIILSILCLLFSNAFTLRRDMSILFNRIAIIALVYCFLHDVVSLSLINKGIGLHGGLLHVTNITQIFHIFVFIVSILILQLTSFFPRKVWVKEHSSLKDLLFNNLVYYRTKIINKMGEHLKIIEYPVKQPGNLLILWGKLSNSGEVLKLLISNLEKNFRGGWANHSCMVKSQKMAHHYKWYWFKCSKYELYNSRAVEVAPRKMDNRGSKSNKGNALFVKEQRVDGSYLLNIQRFNKLRCTLRGFERIILFGIPSIQILSKQLYSTTNDSKNLQQKLSKDRDSFSLNPWFVTGFTDGDGSFTVSVTKKKSGTGWKVVPVYTIGLDQKDLDLLVQIKAFFKIGNIYTSKRGVVYYTVGSVKDLKKYILPHFDKYPLATLKLKDYLLFREIVILMEKGGHNSLPGLLKIFSLKANLNKGLPSVVKAEFPYIIPAIAPEFQIPFDFNPNWFSGFITAEGSFFISLYENEKRKAGYAVSLIFSLSQHIKDLELLERLAKYLGCGVIRKARNRESVEWVITKSEDINLNLIPFLTKYTLSGVKVLDFERFKKASFLIGNKMHLTSEGVTLIKAIKDAMYKR